MMRPRPGRSIDRLSLPGAKVRRVSGWNVEPSPNVTRMSRISTGAPSTTILSALNRPSDSLTSIVSRSTRKETSFRPRSSQSLRVLAQATATPSASRMAGKRIVFFMDLSLRPALAGREVDDLRREASAVDLPGECSRRARKHREGTPVHRNDAWNAQQLTCLRGFARPHRVEISDREQREVGFVELADQGHVGEDVRVSGVVDPETVLERDDVAAGIRGEVRLLSRAGGPRRVDRVHHPEFDAGHFLAPALVHPRHFLDASRAAVESELEDRDDRRPGLLRQSDAILA